MRSDDCTAQASTWPFIVSVKRQYLSRPQLLTVFPLWSARYTPLPTCGRRRIPVFLRMVSVMWAPHQAPIRIKVSDVSLPSQTSAPGTVSAPENRPFPPVSNRLLLTDAMAPVQVPFLSGSRQRHRQTPQSDCGLSGRGEGQDDSDGMVVNHFSNPSPTLPPSPPLSQTLCGHHRAPDRA
jgi:hypothetical protein